jgi:membrane-associated phospholipid phosphatase
MTIPALLRLAPPSCAPARPSTLECLGLLALGYVAFCATYLPINAFTEGRVTHTLFLPGEAAIPLVPAFEFTYALGYFLPLAVVWRRPDWARLARLMRAFGLTLAGAYATYLVFPVYFQRPVLTGHSLATRLLALEYLDRPYNHFPSMHVATATLVALACADDRRLRGWLPAAVAMMAVSTLFVKQHYILDVLAAAALGTASWHLAARRSR